MIISITKRIKLPSGKYKKRVKYSSVKYQIEKVKPLRSHYKLSSLHAAKYHLYEYCIRIMVGPTLYV